MASFLTPASPDFCTLNSLFSPALLFLLSFCPRRREAGGIVAFLPEVSWLDAELARRTSGLPRSCHGSRHCTARAPVLQGTVFFLPLSPSAVASLRPFRLSQPPLGLVSTCHLSQSQFHTFEVFVAVASPFQVPESLPLILPAESAPQN